MTRAEQLGALMLIATRTKGNPWMPGVLIGMALAWRTDGKLSEGDYNAAISVAIHCLGKGDKNANDK